MLAVRFRLGGLAHMLVMLGKVTLAVLVQSGLLLGKVALAVVVQGRLLPMLLVLGMIVLLIMGQACLLWAGWCSILGRIRDISERLCLRTAPHRTSKLASSRFQTCVIVAGPPKRRF